LGRFHLFLSDFEDCYEEIKNLAIYTREQIQELYKRFNYTLCRVTNSSLFNIYKHTHSKELKHFYEREEDDDVALAQLGGLRI
jgi:hypothetical protein